jgi:hypothetical protein
LNASWASTCQPCLDGMGQGIPYLLFTIIYIMRTDRFIADGRGVAN